MDNKKIKEKQQQLLKEVDFLAEKRTRNERKNKECTSNKSKHINSI